MKTLRGDLLRALFLGSVLTIVLLGLLVNFAVRGEVQELLDFEIEQVALSMIGGSETAPGQTESGFEEEPDFLVQIWDSQSGPGRIISGTVETPPARPQTRGFGWSPDGRWRTFSLRDGQRWVQVSQCVRQRRKAALLITLALMGPILLFLVPALTLVVILSVRKGLRPLGDLAHHLREREPHSLSPFPERDLPGEILPLVRELNALLGRLSGALESKDLFLADAAHELRTPMTAVRLQAQLAQRARTPAEREQALADLSRGIVRASHLVDQLLAYGRLGPDSPQALFSDVSMRDVVREAMRLVLPLAGERNIDLGLVRDDDVSLRADRQSLITMTVNLLDNAVRYTPPGGTVDVSLSSGGDGASLRITDSGPGIPEEQREKVFERFYRRHGGENPGSGLGLAIVRQIAERHGIGVAMEDNPAGEGLQVTLSLPGER